MASTATEQDGAVRRVTDSTPSLPMPPVQLELAEATQSDAETAIFDSTEPTPPDGGYGWVCTLSVFLINAHTWGINSSWAVIMAHLSSHRHRIRGSHLEFALIGGLSISQSLMISPIVSSLRKRIGPRWNLAIGTALISTSLLTSSFATETWHLFLSQGLCFGWGMSFAYITASALLPSWFSTRRSLAVGISTAGAGIGGLVYSLVTNTALETFGLAWTYRILALCGLVANSVSSLLLKECGGKRYALAGEARFSPRDFGRIEVLLVMFWGVVTEFGYIALLYSIPSYATSIGLTPTQGSVANALLNLGAGFGRPLLGHFSDIFGRINVAMATTAVCALLCFAVWIPAQSFGVLAVFSLLAGAVCGAFWSTVTPVLGEVVGIKKLANTFTVVCLALVLPTTFAESAAMNLLVKNDTGDNSFMRAQIFVGATFLAGTLSLWLLRCWKIFGAEREAQGEDLTAIRSRHSFGWLNPRLFFRLWNV